MKKFFIISTILIIILITTIYIINYKTLDEIKALLSKGMEISNVYYDEYITYSDYVNSLKQYKLEKYWKDNVFKFYIIDTVVYGNFNTNECVQFENASEIHLDIKSATKFNDYSDYFNEENYLYKYISPCFYNGEWCHIIKLYHEENPEIYNKFYINNSNGLVLKIFSTSDSSIKTTTEFKYQLNVVTDEQVQNAPY